MTLIEIIGNQQVRISMLEAAALQARQQLVRVTNAARELYDAGTWALEGEPPARDLAAQAKLWEGLRDAAGFQPGNSPGSRAKVQAQAEAGKSL